MSLTAESFAFVADVVRQRSAIQLAPGKEYLVESRLQPLARAAGTTVEEYVRALRSTPRSPALDEVVEALTTNETSWFRDGAPFQALTTHVVPALQEATTRLDRISVWSAACSTGQEPYSIAMTLLEALAGRATRVQILGTDLSEQVLERARAGTYSQLEVNRGLPAPMLVRYFQRVGAHWQVNAELRAMTTFVRHNLLHAPPAGGPFDVVFLRNVLIYFDLPTKLAVLDRVRSVLRPDGFLVLGAAETTVGIDDRWERVPISRGALYRPVQGSAARSPFASAAAKGLG